MIISTIYRKVLNRKKFKNHNYFKYANVTTEFPIHDFLFNFNIFHPNIINGFRDMNNNKLA